MSLLTLTVEILLLIANFLSFKKALTRNNFKKDLNALTLTCEHLHTLPTPTLYRTHGSHALHWACEHNAPKTVKLCLTHAGKTYLNTPNPTHKAHIPSSRSVLGSPLCIAVSYKNLGIMRILLNAGADVDFRDYEGRTPLALVIEHAYCYYGSNPAKILDLIWLLLDYGADVDTRDNNRRTPLMRGVEKANEYVVCALLECGADVKLGDQSRISAKDCVEMPTGNDWKNFWMDVDVHYFYNGKDPTNHANGKNGDISDFEYLEDEYDESFGPSRRARESMLELLSEFE